MRGSYKTILILVFVAVVVIVVAMLFPKVKNRASQMIPGNNSQPNSGYWMSTQDGWKASKNPPPCPKPYEFASFTDVSKATSVLYPGQMRSVGYENTAGFRFDGLPNEGIIITAPMDGDVVQAARFLVEGELQYVFDILSPCGIMVRFDHLLVLSPKFQEIANTLPEPKEMDNRSTFLEPPVPVTKGEVIATAVGIRKNTNTFIAWTMFNFNQKK